MSFSASVKQELCRQPLTRKCCALAEAYGVLLYCNTFSQNAIKIVTEHIEFAERLPRLFKKAFNISFDALPQNTESGKLIFLISDTKKVEQIFASFGFSARQNVSLHVNFGVLEDECCRIAFLRGAFLAGGSVTDPEKRYHLEITTSHQKVSRETSALLLDMEIFAKDTSRNGTCVLYFKQSDYIEDFLTLLGAPVSAMSIMQAKVEKDLRNKVNRYVNCETANLTKVVDAAQEQLAAIRRLKATEKFDALPEKLKYTAVLREENPEATLTELAEMMTPSLTKSALNHRMRKLIELSNT